jgi:hypothetical protein
MLCCRGRASYRFPEEFCTCRFFVLVSPSDTVQVCSLSSHVRAAALLLDVGLQSDSTENVFGYQGTSLMVCGDKKAWEEWERVVLAIAPSAFYGGRKPAQANALGVALCTFMTSVYMVCFFSWSVMVFAFTSANV